MLFSSIAPDRNSDTEPRRKRVSTAWLEPEPEPDNMGSQTLLDAGFFLFLFFFVVHSHAGGGTDGPHFILQKLETEKQLLSNAVITGRLLLISRNLVARFPGECKCCSDSRNAGSFLSLSFFSLCFFYEGGGGC
jgi:hypothetical protein